MIEQGAVFDAVRRGYSELELASDSDILVYFDSVNPDALSGHISNVKGILFEQEIANALNDQGLEAAVFEATNHPISDIALMSDDDIAAEVQLKATDSVSYINETLAEHPDIPIIATSEVANSLVDSSMVIDSGIDNAALNSAVTEGLTGTVSDSSVENVSEVASEGLSELVSDAVAPIGPIGLIGALFGLF